MMQQSNLVRSQVSSNCTFIELKLRTRDQSLHEDHRSNRTFMELKFTQKWFFAVRLGGSNRTFMELK